jgi:hypothetical protein
MNVRTHITLQDLIDKDAYAYQCKLFVDTFGDSAKIDPSHMAKAINAGFRVLWLENFIPATARDEYDKAIDAVLVEYDRAMDSVRGASWDEYEKVTDAARVKYDNGKVDALIHALTKQVSA